MRSCFHSTEITLWVRNMIFGQENGYGVALQQYIPLSYLALYSAPHETYSTGNLQTYSVQPDAGSQSIDNMISDKVKLRKGRLMDLVYQIRERTFLKDSNLEKIDHDICECDSEIMRLESWYIGCNPLIDKRKNSLEKDVRSLEAERRDEVVASWKDLSRLKGDFFEALSEYQAASRRYQILGGLEKSESSYLGAGL